MSDKELQEIDGPRQQELISNAKKFVDLTRQKREINQHLKELNEQLAQLEEWVLEDLTTTGVDRMSVDGMTVYTQNQLRCSAKNHEQLTRKLLEYGMGDLIVFGPQKLKGFIGKEADVEKLHPEIVELLDVYVQTRVRARKSD